MNNESTADNYSFVESLRDGLLLDVSDVALKAGLPYPTFISRAFWESVEIDRIQSRVFLGLEGIAPEIKKRVGEGKFDVFEFGVFPNLKRRGWPAAACPYCIMHRVTLEPSERFEVLVIVTNCEETLDFRVSRSASGSFYTM